MNSLTKIIVGLSISFISLKLLSVRPVKRQIMSAIVDGVYIIIKKRLKE
jgi:hypothetical protein